MKSNPIDVITPAFYKEFECAADQCPDHCCHSWSVDVDKKTFKNLKKSNVIVIKNLANEHLKLTRKSLENWGSIQMLSDGNCPFLDESKLCQIHKHSGHQALSNICKSYPRALFWFGDHVEASLSLSCPSAAKNILFNNSAMMFEAVQQPEHKISNDILGGYLHNALPAWMPILRDSCFNILLFDAISIEERLFSIGMLLKQSEQHLETPARLEQLISTVEEMITDGSLSKMYLDLPNNDELKWRVFIHQDKKLEQETAMFGDTIENLTLSTSGQRFDVCRQAVIEQFNQRMKAEKENSAQNQIFANMLKEAKPILDDYFSNKPQVLTNYLLYYFYHNQFLYSSGKTPFQFFRILCVDLFNLKAYLSAMALKDNRLTDDSVLLLFQSYARRRQHEANFIENMEHQLETTGTQSAGAIFGLLK
ncbi:flagellin lysine-N-methylase [Thalassotalea marina]|uniref:Flagellar biosynthesis protein n=1 Tax=Thalassotalea marina TaxID=1673741 RepID=A0A919BAH5_9GAMM|nr:flagellin lysine-N-methylase [Thalassotalea marina]GHF78888.1 flagellar biosynthesis protein [Thalassotalea marina]